jgi:hypothetical protein
LVKILYQQQVVLWQVYLLKIQSLTHQVYQDDTTAMNLQNLTKTANLLDQKQGLAAGMNFLPAVSARKFTPEEMAIYIFTRSS